MSEKQTKPKLTFTRDFNKITFLNQEAFQVMQEALENPSVLDEVEFELDDDFNDFFKEATGEEPNANNVREYLKNELIESEKTYKKLKEKNESVAVNLLNSDGNYQLLDSDRLDKKADAEVLWDEEAGTAFLNSLYRSAEKKEKGS